MRGDKVPEDTVLGGWEVMYALEIDGVPIMSSTNAKDLFDYVYKLEAPIAVEVRIIPYCPAMACFPCWRGDKNMVQKNMEARDEKGN
jgi:hypothetical protein